MGWSIGFDEHWDRDIGYGVPSICDHPKCKKRIDRGLSYVCGGEPQGGEDGCGLFFCGEHLSFSKRENDWTGELEWTPQLCRKCQDNKSNGDSFFAPKPDTADWVKHKLSCPSWAKWREENPGFVERHSSILGRLRLWVQTITGGAL